MPLHNRTQLLKLIQEGAEEALASYSHPTVAPAFAPSQATVSADGRRWRKCAAAAIFNTKGEVLVGERLKIPGSWNCPQGGMDAEPVAESVVQAAAREAHEECGLRLGQEIAAIAAMDDDDDRAVKYEAGGWLKAEGFAGQQLHWALFLCCSAPGDMMPELITNLNGLGGEAAEFAHVKWQRLEEVILGMWPAKRAPYEALASWAMPILSSRLGMAQLLNGLEGRWVREANRNVGVEAALLARGVAAPDAVLEATKPYEQLWTRDADGKSWAVTTRTTSVPSGQPMERRLVYTLGNWDETYVGGSTLYGAAATAEAGHLRRRTGWLAEPDATSAAGDGNASGSCGADAITFLPPSCVAHTTWTARHDGGAEIVSRYRRGDTLVVRRAWLSRVEDMTSATVVQSTETFVRATTRTGEAATRAVDAAEPVAKAAAEAAQANEKAATEAAKPQATMKAEQAKAEQVRAEQVRAAAEAENANKAAAKKAVEEQATVKAAERAKAATEAQGVMEEAATRAAADAATTGVHVAAPVSPSSPASPGSPQAEAAAAGTPGRMPNRMRRSATRQKRRKRLRR